MKLAIIILTIVILSLVIPPAFAVFETLSLKTTQKSVPQGEQFTLFGELKDRNLNPIRSAEITIWEKDKTNQSFLGSTTTNSLGKYQISIIASKWDGTQKDVEIFASAGQYSVKSSTITMYIEEKTSPSSITTNKQNIYHDTRLSLQIADGNEEGYIKVKPSLTFGSGNLLNTDNVSIYVDGTYVATVTSNQWSNDLYVGFNSHSIEAFVSEMTSRNDDSIKYSPSTDTKNYNVIPGIPPIQGGTPPSTPPSKDSDSPIGYVIVGIIIIVIVVGIGIKLSKKKTMPTVQTTPSPISSASNKTQFWGCPVCGNDTKEYLGRIYCHNCNKYL